ncbi:MAG: hypothetical protein ACTS73_05065 [Arsenophonus sp. NEOnobi-MAG3]
MLERGMGASVRIIYHRKPYRLLLAILRFKVSKIRNRSSNGICFNGWLLSARLI